MSAFELRCLPSVSQPSGQRSRPQPHAATQRPPQARQRRLTTSSAGTGGGGGSGSSRSDGNRQAEMPEAGVSSYQLRGVRLMSLLMSAHERKAAAQPRAKQAEVQAACPQEGLLGGQAAAADLDRLQAEAAAAWAEVAVASETLDLQKAQAAVVHEQAFRLQAEAARVRENTLRLRAEAETVLEEARWLEAEAAAVPYKAQYEAALLEIARLENVLFLEKMLRPRARGRRRR